MKKNLLVWLLIWGLVALIAPLFVKEDKGSLLLGISFAALLSLIIMLKLLLENWSGVIIDIFQKTHTSYDDDSGTSTQRQVTYAKLKLDNGKEKNVPYQKNWQIGDKLQKLRGDYQVKVLK